MDAAFIQRIVGNLLDGLVVTLIVVAASMVAGNLLAVPLALARISPRRWLRWPAYVYILFMRGTPLIVQMYMIYFGLAQFREVRQSFLWPLLRDPVWCAIISLSLNTAAYSAEILRGAIQGVPKGLPEAGRSIGLRDGQVMRLITLPLAIRQVLPSLANETILLLKASAIVFTITVRDIMGEANIIRAQTFRTYEPLITAALLYLALTFLITMAFRLVEKRMGRHLVRQPKTIEEELRDLTVR
ncbi:ABC transporter permease [Methylobrevis albus]|uniref:ABC transporter permease n=1 Tax=Methylobrevis albus TaxID=2793297 RepID=A0A931MZA5_9HYPH|nr:ABC transporter permease [Methylobrevis albus]MBH0239272.1 ABC transporter permease [Methylobrevis albus]